MVVRYLPTSELYHHGVKGQQWGKMHGPPYPLDSSVSTGHSLKKREQKYVNKLVKREERSSERAIKKLENKAAREKEDLKKIEAEYNKKYDAAKSEKKKAKLNAKYAKKINKEHEEAIRAKYKAERRKQEAEELIDSYKHYTPADISEDKKRKAAATLKVAVGFVPVVGTVAAIASAPSDIHNEVREGRSSRADYNDYKRKHQV